MHAADIVISPEIGYVIQTTKPPVSTTQPNAPQIIHIHEAHVNIEAQRHIIAILEQLIQQHGLRLILLEGGEGDASLAYLRHYGPLEDRKKVAEQYLTTGLMAGVEYLDMTSEYPLTLWGVEQQTLYEQHINTFIALEPLRKQLRPAVQAAQQSVRRLAPSLYEPALLELDAAVDSFERDTLSLADFAAFLSERAAQAGLPPVGGLSLETEAPQLALFVKLSRMERSGEDVSNLRAQLQPALLSEQLDTLVISLRSRLAVSPNSRRLQAIAEEVALIDKLLGLRLSPGEYRRLRALTLTGLAQRWHATLPAPSREALDALEHALPELLGFYELANARDEALVANSLAKLRETGEPLAVLITGGFHAPQISAHLTAAGYPVISVAPKITTPTNEQLYQAVLNYKHGHGTMAEVEAQMPLPSNGR